MAQAYTPGLRITGNTTIVKERRLPLQGDVLVKKGDRVKAQDVVARTFLPGNVMLLNLGHRLGCDPGNLQNMMLKKVGEQVEKDEVIARTKGLFGLFKTIGKSPITGSIENVSKITGQVQFRGEPQPVSVDAYIDGYVIEVHENEGVTVQTQGAFMQGIIGIGGEAFGEIMVLVDEPSVELTADLITPECKGKILVGGSYVRCETLRKAAEEGVSGIVVGGMDAQDMKDFMGHDLGVAITGTEKLGLTLVITEGFGRMNMARATFDLLKSKEGHLASMNGATQIRAGVLRPEVIIPSPDGEKRSGEGPGETEVGGLKAGTLLRVIRVPHFGRLAKVVSLPPELQKMESETMVRVVEVEFDDGSRVIVPRANVELIES